MQVPRHQLCPTGVPTERAGTGLRPLRRGVRPPDLGLTSRRHFPRKRRRDGPSQTPDTNILSQIVQGLPLHHGKLANGHPRDPEGNIAPYVHRRFSSKVTALFTIAYYNYLIIYKLFNLYYISLRSR